MLLLSLFSFEINVIFWSLHFSNLKPRSGDILYYFMLSANEDILFGVCLNKDILSHFYMILLVMEDRQFYRMIGIGNNNKKLP